MKIFVTGGAGYIGSHTCLELLKKKHEVVVYDNLSNGSMTALNRVKLLSNSNLEFIKGDIRSKDHLNEVMCRFSPDIVIHFAGLKSVEESTINPLKYYDVNVSGSLSLLTAMRKSGCTKIIFSSSATVYGEPNYLPYDEAHAVKPINAYGQTKRVVEQILLDWVPSNNSNQAIVLRYFNPIGAHESGLIGENPLGDLNNIMPYIAQVALGQRPHLSIYGDDYPTRDGTGERDYIHVVDLATYHLKAAENLNRLQKFQILNLGTGSGTTVKELVTVFEQETGQLIKTKITERRLGDVAKAWADPSLAEELLKYKCKRTIENMCRDVWHWQKLNPRGYET